VERTEEDAAAAGKCLLVVAEALGLGAALCIVSLTIRVSQPVMIHTHGLVLTGSSSLRSAHGVS
jgi:hypothetical protein